MTKNGEVYSFGENESGQLGLGHNDEQEKPTFIETFKGIKINKISCGMAHAGVVTGKKNYVISPPFILYRVTVTECQGRI